ncbi:[protein-PII] uridylyltransferase [Nocardioides sp.]|uniref:[protein-PII] uridylyltransferase n=1 Tax=Nocardioides sp. TaxID=35761 RepID=UPI002626446F|nr:[protein-PII] uridylyltransferase [Nocardioides sp.]
MSAAGRAERTAAADALCEDAFAQAAGVNTATPGVALVAVGGFGRGELAPFSDLDVVLVHDEGVDLGEVPTKLWYPLWDSGVKLDHSVRSVTEMVEAATADVRVALGLLDVRHLAGDAGLSLRLRGEMLAHWRRQARSRLPELRRITVQRHELMGELAHASVPDLKEAAGGLRDATILKAIVATWLVDVPHTDLEPRRQDLLDVRDHLHDLTGRAGDRITPELWAPLAERLALPDERAAQAYVRRLGRRLTHLSRLTWRRVDAVLSRPRASAPRRPELRRLEAGVALSGGEIVLEKGADPATDPLLFLRAAALAAENDVVLAPPTAARLAATSAPLPTPWPAEARQLLVRLLAAGKGLLAVWETLDETGAVDQLLPEWERIRLLPHASVIHRFTVDRHVVETCVEAGALIRTVARPDVLMVAALLHDIGKGGLVEHSVAGAPLARAIAQRLGFDDEAVDLIETLVRWHLLLSTTATTRDPDDPATVAAITTQIRTPEALDLLVALTEADARATSPKAWSSWRAALILDLARRARAALAGGPAGDRLAGEEVAIPKALGKAVRGRGGAGSAISMEIERAGDGERLTVIAPDRVGLLADVAATLATGRIRVRAARVWDQPPYGVSVWDLAEEGVDAAVLRTRYEAIREGRVDPVGRLRPAGPAQLAPSVAVRPEASQESTVIEVRATDRPGIVYLVCAALARLEMTVRSAHVDTLGPQAVDVFYVRESHAGALTDTRAAEAAHAVRAALQGDAP